jgi:hypothetical protein
VSLRGVASGVCLLAVIALLGGCGGSSSSGVDPDAYMTSVCRAIAPFENDFAKHGNALDVTSPASSPGQRKAALESLLSTVAKDGAGAVAALKAAGTPDITRGPAISRLLVGAFTQISVAFKGLSSKAQSLPTTSDAAFVPAAKTLGTQLNVAMETIDSSLSDVKSKALNTAAAHVAACHSLS